MSNKVDIAEVEAFSNDLEEVSSDVRSSLDKVQERVNAVNNMESFSGKAAKEAKSYFNELHLTLLESFRGLFDDLNENLNQHIKSFGNEVDASESAVIESNYLQDVKEDINEVFASLKELDESIHDTIGDVSEISSATSPDFSDVQEWKKKSVKKIKEMDEDLGAFTSKDNEVDVQEIMHQIEAVMSKATTSKGKARFADFKGASDNSELAKLMEYNEEKQKIESAMYGDNLEGMSMKQIEQGKSKTLKQLGKQGQVKLNQAFIDLQNGKINRTEYANIIQSELNEGINQGTVSKQFQTDLLQYVDENRAEIAKDFGKDAATASFEQTGLALLKKSIEKSDDAVIMKGPEGSTQWAIVDNDKVETAGKYNKAGQALKWAGKIGGPALSMIGLYHGYNSDIEDGKTPGEAVSHTGGSFLAGAGASGGVILGVTIFSGPVGWVGAGAAVVAGIGSSALFNFAYDNSEKFRTAVDWTGNKIDEGMDWAAGKIEAGTLWTADKVVNSAVYNTIESEVNNVKQKAGEAVKQVVDGTVNQGKKKLNDIKRSAGEALKEKIFGFKKPKMNWGWNE